MPQQVERIKTPPLREKNARGEIIVDTIRLRDLEPKAKVTQVEQDESESEEEEEEEPVKETQEEVKGKLRYANMFSLTRAKEVVQEGTEEVGARRSRKASGGTVDINNSARIGRD